MKKAAIILISIIVVSFISSLSIYFFFLKDRRIVIENGFGRGRNFAIGFTDHERAAYVQGFVNGITVHPFLNLRSNYDILLSCALTKRDIELAAVIADYIAKTPSEAAVGLNIRTYNALLSYCAGQG